MKKILAIIACSMLASATFSYAGLPARTGVNGSLHDMNYYAPLHGGQQENFNRVCVYCHTPHTAVVVDPTDLTKALPLWNHDLPTTIYTPYQWATPANLPFTIVDPLIGPSRLCMSCHDGSIAVDEHGPASPMAGTVKLSGPRAVGASGDLTNDHPIGFDYTQARTARNTKPGDTTPTSDFEVVDETSTFASGITVSNTAGTYNTVQRLGTKTISSTLYDGKYMTCASCHDVHNKENAVQDAGNNGTSTPNYFLWAKESQSLICLSCHIK